jgi:hypothetical protein
MTEKRHLQFENYASMAAKYNCDVRTFKNILKEKGIIIKPVGKIILVVDVEKIYEVLGNPDKK